MNSPAAAAGGTPLPKSLPTHALALSNPPTETYVNPSTGYFSGYAMDGFSANLADSYKYFETQHQTLWCWIAVSSTVANFYKGLAQVYTQEAVYCQVTMLPGCENVVANSLPSGPPCNQSGYPPIPMRVLNILGAEFEGRPPIMNTEDPVLGELLNSRPVVVGLAVQGGRTQYSHAVVLDAGFNFNGQDYWNICDPTAGISMVSVYTFPTGFPDRQNQATQWLETWFTVNPN